MVFAEALCANLLLSAPIHPGLNPNERRMVCGDPSPGQEAWSRPAPTESQFYLKNFLQARGYHHPKFERNEVDPGPRSRVTELTASGAPEGFDITRRRRIVGQFLTPEILTEVERWAIQRLHALGYGCAEAKVAANPDTGEVHIQIKPGEIQNLLAVEEEPIDGLTPKTLRRYDAFAVGERYDGELVRLTEERVKTSEIVQVGHLQSRCKAPNPGVTIKQDTIPGPPRLLSAGVGINTEGVLLGRASWRSVRLGPQGSRVGVTLRASVREQRLEALADAYLWPPASSAFFLHPEVSFFRQDELAFESLNARALVAPTWGTGTRNWVFSGSLGPAFDQIRTLRGTGPAVATFTSLDLNLNAHTPDFELYRTQPRSGWDTSLAASFADSRLLSDATAQRLVWRAQVLWNVAEFDPPLLVLGLRTRVATILTPERAGAGSRLPATFLEYLGGSGDLRGFGRKELSLGGAGGLSSAYLGAEARIGPLLPLGFEPLVFFDAGVLGTDPVSWNSSIYWSPGLGMRWPSPIGVFRFTLALGFVQGAVAHPQFYLGYGEEF